MPEGEVKVFLCIMWQKREENIVDSREDCSVWKLYV